ncbi:AAA family ATPase [Litchfieldia salsa]|uniref:Adenylate kinase n=1 Tax=Litchfieldia salsa TaxID=930152 RepID=A0A1H0SXG0_9BACI|nr:AAA family ATPase [Litchfieldia salsa]SDP46301.1 Adenylate kinase [Litchfieldia salsa]
MYKRIHIFGAAGTGTTTLGTALIEHLQHRHLDTDDYFWITKYTEQRQVPDRIRLLNRDLTRYEKLILTGAICGWGDQFKQSFDLVIFLSLPKEIRLKRLQLREYERYGEEALEGGSKFEQSKAFLDWASLYDEAGMDVRSKTLHEHWMSDLHCPVLRIEGDYSVQERVKIVLDYLKEDRSIRYARL